MRTYGEDGGKDSRAYIPAMSGQESRIRAGDWQWEWKEDKSRTLEFSGPNNMADGGGVLEIGSSGRVPDGTRKRMSPTRDNTVEKWREMSPTRSMNSPPLRWTQ